MDHSTNRVKTAYNLFYQTTSFIGREPEIAEILDLLDDPIRQLLTLVGPGGTGKTRLALEIARRMSDFYTDGVYFIPLQPLQSPLSIPSAIASVLRLPVRDHDDPLQQLTYYLSTRQVLLILDNFEHLIEGAEIVARIAVSAHRVRLIVTSREPLNLHEEWQWIVRGLSYPITPTEPLSTDVEAYNHYSAIRLFIERTRQIRPNFTFADQATAVARICQLVEGIPLAIEMAAQWTKTLTCDAIARAIQQDIDFLTSREHNIHERHRSMRAVYNHSWRLLTEEQRVVFEKLSVFRGGFTREAGEQVAGATLESLASLIDKSFLRQEESGRYTIHELLRQYGDEQLEQFGNAAATADAHAVYFADFLEKCLPDLKNDRQLAALNIMEPDFENIAAAWVHAVSQQAYHLLDHMLDSLFMFGVWRDRPVEVSRLFEMAARALSPLEEGVSHPVYGRILVRAFRGDFDAVERALAIARTSGHPREIAYCLLERGVLLTRLRDFTPALSDLQTALELYRQIDSYGVIATLLRLIYYFLTIGDIEEARRSMDAGLRLAREVGNPAQLYNLLFYVGWSACFNGQYADSERDLEETLTIADRLGFRVMAADSMGSLGFLAFLRGDFQQARSQVTSDLAAVTLIRATGEQGFARIVQAHITCLEGNYQEARQIAEEALALVRPHPIRERFIARVLAMAECGLGHFDRAYDHARMALLEEKRPGTRLWILPVFVLLLEHEGLIESAAQLLGLVFTHPASATGWLEKWSLLNDLRTRLEVRLGAAAFIAAWERGAQRDLDDVVEELLLLTHQQAAQPLAEPLTDRELEVLRLIAVGLSNHEIAETLTIVEGTVRTHVYNLCQKLGAHNRTHAVAQARALHLLR